MVPAPAESSNTGIKELVRGLAVLALGKQVEAMQTLDEGRVKLEAVLSTHPDAAELHQTLASIQAARAEKERAIEEAEKSVALLPITKEAEQGLYALETLAEVHAHFADADQAIPLIRQLLNADGAGLLMTPALLKLDPIWDPIRGDPRFKAIVQGPTP